VLNAGTKDGRFIKNRRILKWIENGEVKKSVGEKN